METNSAYIVAPTEKVRSSLLKDYIQLTKPTIMILVLFTAVTALVVEGSMMGSPWQLILLLLGIYLTGGAANALNQYLERDIDARMTRTSKRRPLPTSRLNPTPALLFAVTIGVVGLVILWHFFNLLTMLLSLGTILFYSFFYTLILKPKTSQNIVIGGVAGSMAPVGAWAAATGHMAVFPWLLFLIVFLWTPPHFWALALAYKEDYIRAKLPMLPVVKGNEETMRQIILYSWLLIIVSLALPFFGSGVFYTAIALFLGVVLLKKAFQARKSGTERDQKRLFGFSIIYLFGLFSAVIVDALIPWTWNQMI